MTAAATEVMHGRIHDNLDSESEGLVMEEADSEDEVDEFLHAEEEEKRRREKTRTVAGHCHILGIEPTTDPAEIKKGYTRAALRHHPDKGGDVASFQRIHVVYKRLNALVGIAQDAPESAHMQDDEDIVAEHAACASVFARGGIFACSVSDEKEIEEEDEAVDSEQEEVRKARKKEMKSLRKKRRREDKRANMRRGGPRVHEDEAAHKKRRKSSLINSGAKPARRQ